MSEDIKATIKSARPQAYCGGKYYRVTATLEDGGEYSFETSVDQMRKFAEAGGYDSISDLTGCPIILKPKKSGE